MIDQTMDLKEVLGEPSQGRTAALGHGVEPAARDLGRADGLRHAVLTLVSQEQYLRAIQRLKDYQETKRDYPQFSVRAGRYIGYCCDLINAIKAKRSFPGIKYLGISKQKELYEKAREHFEDLTATLRKIEQIDREVRAEDVRSIVWVVKALIYSACLILVLAFLREVSHGVLPAAEVVIEDGFDQWTDWFFDTLGI